VSSNTVEFDSVKDYLPFRERLIHGRRETNLAALDGDVSKSLSSTWRGFKRLNGGSNNL
jgi:hypothetical protein|tara:strand:- start:98 stop:274 length:177 start_codon:yes stop_codon:yes gene_type:complete